MGALDRARRLPTSARLLLAALLLATIATAGTYAVSVATGNNAKSSLSTTALYWPSGFTAAPAGASQTTLSWTEPANKGNGNGYSIYAYHFGTASGSCSSSISSYTWLAAVATGTTSYTDTSQYGGGTSTYWGQYTCYLIQTWYAPGNPAPGSPAWTSTTTAWGAQGTPTYTTSAVQIGFVARSVALANGGTSGTADSGDTIAVTYNQAATVGSLTALNVCFTHTTNTIYIADAGGSTCGTATAVGTLTGGSYSPGSASKDSYFTITSASFSGNTLTVTLGTVTNKTPSGFIGPWTFTPSTSAGSVQSVANTSFPCATGTSCLPVATGGF